MAKLVMYIDGSAVQQPVSLTHNTLHVGWGAVAQYDNRNHEMQGAFVADKALDGYHELVALVEAARFAAKQGVAMSDLSIYTDDQSVGYANTTLHPDNRLHAAADRLRLRLNFVCEAMYNPTIEALALDALSNARITWVKGHRFLVYQSRADYLARNAARSSSRGRVGPRLSFERWLAKGFSYYTAESTQPQVFHVPFTHLLVGDQGKTSDNCPV